MASAKDTSTQLDITTCVLCKDTLQTPKALPCLHSFCEKCINDYMRKTIGQTKGGVNCPLCRTFVLKPDDTSIEEWTSKLPTNPVVVSLIAVNGSICQRLCAACSRENETESACSWCVNCGESLCQLCERYHRKNKCSSDHKLIDIESSLTSGFPLNRIDIACTEHPDKKVEAYCRDHSAVCCTTCALLKHRKCENVGPLEDAAEQKKQSNEIKNFQKGITEIQKSLEAMVQDRRENLQSFDKDIQNIRSEVGTLFTQLSIHLNRLRSDILLEISRINREVRPEIENKVDEINCRISAAKNDLVLFETTMKNSPPAQFLQMMEKLLEQKMLLEKFINDKSQEIKEIRATFNASDRLIEMTKCVKAFGKVNISRKRKEKMRKSFDIPSTKSTVISSPSAMVEMQGLVTGIALLDNGYIVLSNYSSQTLEVRDGMYFTILSRLPLTSRPWGIKMTSDTQGALAVENQILTLFKIMNNRIEKMQPRNVTCEYVHQQGKYYVTHGKDIVIYNSSRSIVRVISAIPNVHCVAVLYDTSCCYTCTNGNELFCINTHGLPVFTYSHARLKSTTGVTADHAGFIYVCGKDSRNIHQLRNNGTFYSIILDHLPAEPYCISFNEGGNKAVVGCNNRVLLYNLEGFRLS